MLVEFEHFGYIDGFFKTEEVSNGRTYINPIYVKGLEQKGSNRVQLDLIDGSWRIVGGTLEEVAVKLNTAMPKEGVAEAVAAAAHHVELRRQEG